MKPGPQLPYRERHHAASWHGSPVQEYSFSGTYSVVVVVAEVSAVAGEFFDWLLVPFLIGSGVGRGVGSSVTDEIFADDWSDNSTYSSFIAIVGLSVGLCVGGLNSNEVAIPTNSPAAVPVYDLLVGALVVGALVAFVG